MLYQPRGPDFSINATRGTFVLNPDDPPTRWINQLASHCTPEKILENISKKRGVFIYILAGFTRPDVTPVVLTVFTSACWFSVTTLIRNFITYIRNLRISFRFVRVTFYLHTYLSLFSFRRMELWYTLSVMWPSVNKNKRNTLWLLNIKHVFPSCSARWTDVGTAGWSFSLWILSALRRAEATWQHIAAPLIRSNSQSKETTAAYGRHISSSSLSHTLTSHSFRAAASLNPQLRLTGAAQQNLEHTFNTHDDWTTLQRRAEQRRRESESSIFVCHIY